MKISNSEHTHVKKRESERQAQRKKRTEDKV